MILEESRDYFGTYNKLLRFFFNDEFKRCYDVEIIPLENSQLLVFIKNLNVIEGNNLATQNFELIYNSLIKALDEVEIGINIIDKNFKIQYQNKPMRKSFGDLQGKLCYKDFMKMDAPCELCSLRNDVKSKILQRIEIKEQNGETYSLISSPISEKEGITNKVIDLIINITKYKDLEANLLKTEQIFRETFENASDAIFWGDVETGKIINCNKKAEKLLEKSKEEIIGLHQKFLHPPNKREYYAQMFKKHIESNGNSEDDAEVVTKSGKIIPVHISVSRITINNKNFMQGIFRDMQEQKSKLAKINLLSSAIEQSNEGIKVTDLEGHIIFANKAFAIMHGYEHEELIGKHISLFHNKDQMIAVNNANSCVKREGIFKGEIWHQRKDGIIFPSLMTITLLKNGSNNPIGMIAIAKEITDLKRAEKELKQSKERYRTAFKKAEFLRDIFTHDVNNIFQSILSAHELIKLYCRDSDKENQILTNLSIIEDQINRGKNLISNIRKFTKLDVSEIRIKPINIFECLEKSLKFVRNLYSSKKIKVQIQSSFDRLNVRGNKLLYEIFNNLFMNAIVYNNNPVVELIIIVSKQQENNIDYVKVEIIDNAKGITDEYKEKIFQRGYKKDHFTKGFGIGLALVKKIIDRFNGKIWVEDRFKGDFKRGSRFNILLNEA
ncbi:MAG: PAS domain S-box protein [Candidatus Lokiarchaeota archaeon]